jgi:hypothetical protein
MELPIWGWILGVVGVIGAGIGLGYLIIWLFWKTLGSYFVPVRTQPQAPPVIELENSGQAELAGQTEAFPEPEDHTDLNLEKAEIMVEQMENEKPAETLPDVTPEVDRQSIKFAVNLKSGFQHSFKETGTIVCWNMDIHEGEAVRDKDGLVLKLHCAQTETGSPVYTLQDEFGHAVVRVFSLKNYLKKETGLDIDRVGLIKP